MDLPSAAGGVPPRRADGRWRGVSFGDTYPVELGDTCPVELGATSPAVLGATSPVKGTGNCIFFYYADIRGTSESSHATTRILHDRIASFVTLPIGPQLLARGRTRLTRGIFHRGSENRFFFFNRFRKCRFRLNYDELHPQILKNHVEIAPPTRIGRII